MLREDGLLEEVVGVLNARTCGGDRVHSPAEVENFVLYTLLAFGGHPSGLSPDVSALLGTFAVCLSIKAGDDAASTQEKIAAHFEHHPPKPELLEAFLRAVGRSNPALDAGKAKSIADLLGQSLVTRCAEPLENPKNGVIRSGPAARFELNKEK